MVRRHANTDTRFSIDNQPLLPRAASSPQRKSSCIRPALHPGWLRCFSVEYCRYAPSARLTRRAHHRSQWDAGPSRRTAGRPRRTAADRRDPIDRTAACRAAVPTRHRAGARATDRGRRAGVTRTRPARGDPTARARPAGQDRGARRDRRRPCRNDRPARGHSDTDGRPRARGRCPASPSRGPSGRALQDGGAAVYAAPAGRRRPPYNWPELPAHRVAGPPRSGTIRRPASDDGRPGGGARDARDPAGRGRRAAGRRGRGAAGAGSHHRVPDRPGGGNRYPP